MVQRIFLVDILPAKTLRILGK